MRIPLDQPADDLVLDELLAVAKDVLDTAVRDRLAAQGGVPDLRDPDLALDRLLVSAHRETGTAIAIRCELEHRFSVDNQGFARMRARAARGLKSRPAALRLKYRDAARRILARYWPSDLDVALGLAVELLERLTTWEQDISFAVHDVVDEVGARLGEVLLLPNPWTADAQEVPQGYLGSLERRLSTPADELFLLVYRARQMFDEELVPLLRADISWGDGGLSMVAQDLVDDLEYARRTARKLARTRAEVEAARSDFTGADLRDTDLEGVSLKGVLWDATTFWPALWEAQIRRASTPRGDDGVLVVAVEPQESAVPADV
ncbi:hypothetical protein DWB77_06863 [Streptomyces hundungensis]|uniref:Uncharacterized protein n=1 Tax=Streptomyces hundungensis TaxID=1077946 RepID=A0A387HMB4_9ACTN|nr:hypothetical protein [Streptomyces hundungensis]AYG84649.1 hypothetical protein DWB77_06863 [Streptomyces hundungensis]